MNEALTIDPTLWRGDDIDARLRRHFVDLRSAEAFHDFIAARRARDESAAIAGWRRIYDRSGTRVLAALVTWKGKEKLWRFPLLTQFVDPEDDSRYFVFDCALPRIGLDLGIAMRDSVYEALAAVD